MSDGVEFLGNGQIRIEFEWHGRAWMRRTKDAAAKGIGLGMELVLAESNKLVPLREGTLERSGRTAVNRSTLEGAVGYDTVYAARQHEELTWKHLPGRSAKFLEIAFNDNARTVEEIIAETIRREAFAGGRFG